MGIIEILIIAIGLSMDAFAVSIGKGLSMQKMSYKNALTAGVFFGGFQAIMPLIGFLLGIQFKSYITTVDHWVAFVLLSIIGGRMVWESRGTPSEGKSSFDLKTMTMLAIATSIDALAIGVTFAFLQVDIIPAVSLIGITTFGFSFAGVKIGHFVGAKFESKAELVGGLVLIAIGLRILLNHLGIIG
jgi:manganese efflux pump family protein